MGCGEEEILTLIHHRVNPSTLRIIAPTGHKARGQGNTKNP